MTKILHKAIFILYIQLNIIKDVRKVELLPILCPKVIWLHYKEWGYAS